MEFNVFEYFKDYKRTTNGPLTPEEQGTSLFLARHMDPEISVRVDGHAAKARMSRRHFLGTASGFAPAMLAGHAIAGVQVFDAPPAAASDPAPATELRVSGN